MVEGMKGKIEQREEEGKQGIWILSVDFKGEGALACR